MPTVTMMCMSTKQKFEAEDPPVVVLANGRYAYRAECPTPGKDGAKRFAYKFCSKDDYQKFVESIATEEPSPESE